MVIAQLKNLRIAPRKVRLVADVIRGLDVEVAENQLLILRKRAAGALLKLLRSAVANAETNFKFKKSNLYIAEIKVDEGQSIDRWMPRAMGRATPIIKRNSQVMIKLAEKVKSEVAKDKKEKEKKQPATDVKVVKSLAEIKKMGKAEEVEKKKEKALAEGSELVIEDVRREGKHREKQHLDKLRKKSKGGFLKRMFRRKTV